jgi:hypothetical protein
MHAYGLRKEHGFGNPGILKYDIQLSRIEPSCPTILCRRQDSKVQKTT